MALPTVLVTGASGFIGRHLLSKLAAEKVALLLLARAEEQAATLEAAREAGLGPERATVRVVDWGQPASLRAALGGAAPAQVFHLAGERVMGWSGGALERSLAANLRPTAALLEALLEAPPEVFVFSGTAEVYGDQPAPFREDAPLAPATAYGVTKAMAEAAGLASARGAGFPFVAARLAVVYGPGQPPVMFVPQLIEAALRGEPFAMSPGEQVRDLVYVGDAADALLALARVPAARGQAVNVGSGEGVKLRALAERLHALLGHPMPLLIGSRGYREGESMEYRLDTARIARLTGWAPAVTLEDGLARTIEWARATRGAPARTRG